MVFFTVFFTENSRFRLSLNKVPFSTCKKFPHEIILETLLPLRKVTFYVKYKIRCAIIFQLPSFLVFEL